MTRSRLHAGLVPGALAAGVVTALALAGGGFGGIALGVATGTVWIVVVALVLAGVAPSRQPPPGLIVAVASLLALLLLTVLSTGWTTSDEAAFEEAVRLAGCLGIFLLAGLLARRERIGPALTGLAAAGVLVAVVALGSRLLGIGGGDADLVAELPSASGRLSFPIGYWNALGALVALSVPPLCWQAARVRSHRLSGLALAGFPPLIAAGYLTSSRGAVLAVAIGLAITVGSSAERRRTAAAAALGLAASIPVVLIATFASGMIDTPGNGSIGRPEVVTLAALLLGVLGAFLLGGRLIGPVARSRPFSIDLPVRGLIVTAVAAATAIVIAVGPSALIGDLRAGTDAENSAGNDRTTGIISASGSGRAQFWDAATGAFADEPFRGIGAGGYADYWNRHGALKTPARNAHSEPLEVLAELGLAGFFPFLGFVVVILVCAMGRVRSATRDEGAGAALGLIVAGMFSFAIDWTWDVPAVAVPVLIAAGMTCSLAPPSRLLEWVPSVPRRAVALAAVVVAVPAVWAGAVLGSATGKLEASADAFAEGRLNEAAAAARSAAAIEPWATEPWLQLAIIEQAGGNFDASLAAVQEAIDRNGSNVRAWMLATSIALQRLDGGASAAYFKRVTELSLPE